MKNKVFSSIWIAKKLNERGFILTPLTITLYAIALLRLIYLIQLQYFFIFFLAKFSSCCLSTVWRAQLHEVHSSNHPMYYDSVPENKF